MLIPPDFPRRRRNSNAGSRPRRHRRLHLESLETRRLLAVFTVNSTGDENDSYLDDGICDTAHNPTTDPPTPRSNICTLRAASQQASSSPDSDRIEFDIPAPDGSVPVISGDVAIWQGSAEIDGTTQAAGRVSVSGVTLGGSGGSLVKGLVVRDGGISVISPNNTIVGNFVEVDATGTANAPGLGIRVIGDGNRIGGPDPAERNVFTTILVRGDRNAIIGNHIGVDVTGETALTPGVITIDDGVLNVVGGATFAHGNVIVGTTRIQGVSGDPERSPNATLIQNNRIGTNRSGTAALPYPGPGILLANTADTAILSNTIAAAVGPPVFVNAASGIVLAANTTRTSIEGNKIGTDIGGTTTDPDGTPGSGDEFGNRDYGIVIDGQGIGSTGNTIGGTSSDKSNVISGNRVGISLLNRADGNVIVGNFVGTDASGVVPLSNETGIEILFSGSNVVGGTLPNVISGNLGTGLLIGGVSAIDNLVAGNRIGTNTAGNAPLPNDVGVLINDAPQNCIGGILPSGTASGSICTATSGSVVGNVVSGNKRFGIQIANSNAHDNVVQANLIGTDLSGMISDPDGVGESGDELGNGFAGVSIQAGAGNNTIGGSQPSRRNVISGNQGDGILVIGVDGSLSENNVISGNYIGVDATGTTGLGNGGRGIHIDGFAAGNTIGGDLGGDRNIISGNGADGVIIFSDTARDNTIKGNYIGTDQAGTVAVPNSGNGVYLWRSAGNLVGEVVDTSTVGNLISGNRGAGVRIEDPSATENTLVGNLIGTDATGTSALRNEGPGVSVVNAPRNIIGGSFLGNPLAPTFPGNVISGNQTAGIRIEGSQSQTNFVGANLVGTDHSGTKRLGNFGPGVHVVGAPGTRIGQSITGEPALTGNTLAGNVDGVRVEQPGAAGTIIAANKIGTAYDGRLSGTAALLGNVLSGVALRDVSDTLIGGVAFDGNGGAVQLDGNLIAENLRGVRIEGTTARFNTVQRNSIYGNRRQAIDLGDDGATPNDPLDADSGPNTLLNKPVIERLSQDLKLTIAYDGEPNKEVTLDIYRSDSDGGDDAGQAQEWLRQVTLTTDSTGKAEIAVPVDFDSDRPFLTATATDVAGNTSEISGPLRLPDLTIDPFSLFPNDVTKSGGRYILPYDITVRNTGTARATNAVVRILGNGQPLGLSGSQVTLDPSESITISGTWDITDILNAGVRGVASIELAATVDPADRIEELPVAVNHRSATADLDGRPVITRLDKQLAEGIFLQDVVLPNRIDVYVDWNGNLDGITVVPNDRPRVWVELNGGEIPPLGDTSLIESVPTSFSIEMGGDLSPGTNAVRVVAELRGAGFESPVREIQYDLAASAPWIATALWTVETDGGPFDQIAVYHAGVAFPDFATEGFFGVPVDKVGFAGGTFGSSFPPTTIRASVRSDGGTQLEGQIKMGAEVGGDATGGAEAAFVAGLTGAFRFDPDLTLETLEGTLAGEAAVTTPKIPFPAPASFLRAQGKIGLGVNATLSVVDENGQLQWPTDLVLGLEPSLEAIVSLEAGPASVEAGAGGSIRGDFSLAGNPCVPLGGEVTVFVRVAASFLVFEVETSYSFPFTLPACGGGAGEGELQPAGLPTVQSELRVAPRYLSAVYGPAEGETGSGGLPTILYPFAKPSLARHSDGTMTLVYVGEDTAKSTGQQLEIFAAHFDGESWSAPVQLTDDTLLDDTPSVTYDAAGNAVAVWSRVKTELSDPSSIDPASLLADLELVYAVYDSNTGAWSAPAVLTEDAEMDYLPTITTGTDGTVMAAWLHDAQNDTLVFPGDTQPLGAEYRFATWNGSAWSASATAVGSVTTNEMPRLAMGAGEAILVWSEDADGDADTTSDRDILASTWDGTNWSAPHSVSVSNDGIADVSPSVIYTSENEAEIIWVRTGVPLSEAPDDVTDQLYHAARSTTGFAAPQLAVTAESISSLALTLADDGAPLAVWQGRSETGPDLFYSKAGVLPQPWSNPIQFTDSRQLEWQLNPYVDRIGELQVLFLERSIGQQPFGGQTSGEGETHRTVPTFVGSTLNSASRPLGADLAVVSLELQGAAVPGATVGLRALVENRGDRKSPEVSAALFEDGTKFGGSLLVPELASGERQTVEFDWSVPAAPSAPVGLEVRVDSDNEVPEADESNNVASLVVLQPDLQVTDVRALHDQSALVVQGRIRNAGPTPIAGPFDLALRLDDPQTGTVVGTATVSALGAGESADVAIRIEQALSTLGGRRRGYVVVDSGRAIGEQDEGNNARLVALNPYQSWQNPFQTFDVNADGFVSPRDALLLITELTDVGAHRLPIIPSPPRFVDTSGDNLLSPLDVLLVIDFLASPGEGESELRRDEWVFGESEDWTSHLLDLGDDPASQS